MSELLVKELSIDHLRDLVRASYEAFRESRDEANRVLNFYHNRQLSSKERTTLANRGQPAETFNVVKLFTRLIIGYYSTVVNNIVVSPRQFRDIPTASILNDIVKYLFETNHMETEGDKIKRDGLLTGLMCSYIDVEDTGERDQFNRPINTLTVHHVPTTEILLDASSVLEDYSDAMYLHRYKWMLSDILVKLFPKKKKEILALEEFHNWSRVDDADFDDNFPFRFTGEFRTQNYYLLMHTVITDSKDKTWNIFWIDNLILSKKEITFKEVRFPYRVQRLETSNIIEYYGIFREVIESQRAINQAVNKIQLMVNSQKIFYKKGSVEDLAEFTNSVNRVNSIIAIKSMSDFEVVNMTRDIADQYLIVEKGFDRIKQVLGVTDSFLGQAFASDSGRKVKLQQNQTALALRYVTLRIEQYYRLLGWDMVNLIKQYFTATQVIRIADEVSGARWIQLNQPMMQPTGEIDETGQPEIELVFEQVLDPGTEKPMVDKDGNLIFAPISTRETDISFTDVDLSIDSIVFNDQDEKAQLILETFLSGQVGQALLQVNPAGFFSLSSQAIQGLKSKNSPMMAEILNQTAESLRQGPPQPVNTGNNQNNPRSAQLKLPTNTNEGVE